MLRQCRFNFSYVFAVLLLILATQGMRYSVAFFFLPNYSVSSYCAVFSFLFLAVVVVVLGVFTVNVKVLYLHDWVAVTWSARIRSDH